MKVWAYYTAVSVVLLSKPHVISLIYQEVVLETFAFPMTDPTEVNSSALCYCQNHFSPLLKGSLILNVMSKWVNIVTLCHPSTIPSCRKQPAGAALKIISRHNI